MTINSRSALLSLRQEADRQSAFYLRKLNEDLAGTWSDIASLADEAAKTRQSISITLINSRGENGNSPTPIKGGEQVEQLHNPNVIKAIR